MFFFASVFSFSLLLFVSRRFFVVRSSLFSSLPDHRNIGEERSFKCSRRIVSITEREPQHLYTTREEVEVTESDTGQRSEKVQHWSPSGKLDE